MLHIHAADFGFVGRIGFLARRWTDGRWAAETTPGVLTPEPIPPVAPIELDRADGPSGSWELARTFAMPAPAWGDEANLIVTLFEFAPGNNAWVPLGSADCRLKAGPRGDYAGRAGGMATLIATGWIDTP